MAIQGGYAYSSGFGGATVSVPAYAMVKQISSKGTTNATISIGGGTEIDAVPSFKEYPMGNMIGPFDIVFTNTDSYFVSWVV